ncbi:MFS transporter [Kutzneria sp. CA-103260]|uniref:MFS transporter n=1 Tax=Kutzneria sp. CA-103260 TaxID=2802641 RepID=UPI001BA957E0|nr:MFS transporter [Kutzneria sp. CA-103260]
MSSPLKRPAFRWFITGQTVSLLGGSMAPVALTFAVLDASNSTTQLGVVLVARMVPLLVFLLIGGATADRFSRRTVLVLSNIGSALTQGAVAAVLLTGHYSLALVSVLELLNGVLTAFTTPTLRGVLPELVEKTQLRQANSLLGTVRNATKVFGPSVSGLLVVAVGSGPAIAADAASFLVAAVCLSRLPLSGHVSGRKNVLRDIHDGWTQFRTTPWLWPVTVAFCLVNLVLTGTWQILGPELTRQLSDIQTWGFVLSVRGIGLLLMGVVMYRLVVRRLLRFGLLIGVLSTLPLITLGLHLHAPWLMAAAFIGGLGFSALGIAWDTSLQEHVPTQSLSRVSSFDDLLSYIAIPIGQLLVGPLSSLLGGFHLALFAGLLAAAAALAPLASPAVRRLPHHAADPQRTPTPQASTPAAPDATYRTETSCRARSSSRPHPAPPGH